MQGFCFWPLSDVFYIQLGCPCFMRWVVYHAWVCLYLLLHPFSATVSFYSLEYLIQNAIKHQRNRSLLKDSCGGSYKGLMLWCCGINTALTWCPVGECVLLWLMLNQSGHLKPHCSLLLVTRQRGVCMTLGTSCIRRSMHLEWYLLEKVCVQ